MSLKNFDPLETTDDSDSTWRNAIDDEPEPADTLKWYEHALGAALAVLLLPIIVPAYFYMRYLDNDDESI